MAKMPVAQQLESEAKTPASEVEEVESELATQLISSVLRGSKMQKAYAQAAQAKNPMVPLALIVSQTILSAREKMIEKQILSSDKIWAAEGGVIDNLVYDENAPWDEAGIGVVPADLKQEVFKLLAKYEEASSGPEAKMTKPVPGAPDGAAPQQPPGASALGVQPPAQPAPEGY